MEEVLCIVATKDFNTINESIVYLFKDASQETIDKACEKFNLEKHKTPNEVGNITYLTPYRNISEAVEALHQNEDCSHEDYVKATEPFVSYYGGCGDAMIALALVKTEKKFANWDLD